MCLLFWHIFDIYIFWVVILWVAIISYVRITFHSYRYSMFMHSMFIPNSNDAVFRTYGLSHSFLDVRYKIYWVYGSYFEALGYKKGPFLFQKIWKKKIILLKSILKIEAYWKLRPENHRDIPYILKNGVNSIINNNFLGFAIGIDTEINTISYRIREKCFSVFQINPTIAKLNFSWLRSIPLVLHFGRTRFSTIGIACNSC